MSSGVPLEAVAAAMGVASPTPVDVVSSVADLPLADPAQMVPAEVLAAAKARLEEERQRREAVGRAALEAAAPVAVAPKPATNTRAKPGGAKAPKAAKLGADGGVVDAEPIDDDAVPDRAAWSKGPPVNGADEAWDGGDVAPSPGGGGGRVAAWRIRLDGAPIVPLGLVDDVYFYLDGQRQLRELRAKDHGRLNLQSLVGADTGWLWRTYPKYNKEGEQSGWAAEHLAEDLMRACSHAGVWHSRDRERGLGAWRGDDGELVLHLGDIVLVRPVRDDASGMALEREERAGLVGWHVYPGRPPLGRPLAVTMPRAELQRYAESVLALLKSWNWRRGDKDARLMLGWCAAAMIGGALEWRPMIWLTGGSGTGKSMMQKLLDLLFGRGALERTADTTAAGVRQALGRATLPVAFEESEASEDNRAINAVVKFARDAASGGRALRGGSDHQGIQFVAQSCFQFASILIPPLTPQDRSRIAVLDLDKLKAGAKVPALDSAALGLAGAAMRRRLLDIWPEFDARWQAWRERLTALGHSARGADQYGTLLMLADALLHDAMPDESAAWDAELEGFAPVDLGLTGEDGDGDDLQCLSHLATSIVEGRRGDDKRTVGGWIAYVIEGYNQNAYIGRDRLSDANKALAPFGMKLHWENDARWLAVANRHQSLATIFAATRWQTLPGATGGWVQSLRRVAGAKARDGLSFDGSMIRCTLLPLAAISGGAAKQGQLSLDRASATPAPTPTPGGGAE
ncbi:hypothetical protein [Ferrovibrio sp.]|uniref:hypothetical protein n=1 Tax=Ferrovibrio sp. TaxID=1917215 RepID=UPI003D0A8364